MVREVKFSCDTGDRRSHDGLAALTRRASVLDDDRGPRERLRRPKRSRKAERKDAPPAVAAESAPVAVAEPAPDTVAPPARPVTPRRGLAGADWLTDYAPLVRKSVRKAK